jgi:hypothetical protein
MRIFGFSAFTLLLIFVAFYLGAKNPGALAKVGL